MSVSTIAFDAYGSLIDTADGSVRATRDILLKHGCGLDPRQVYATWKSHHKEIISTLTGFLPEETLFAAGLRRVCADYGIAGDPDEDVQIMLATLGTRKLFGDARPCLERLRGRFEVVIASNTDSLPFQADLRNNNLTVDSWFTSESLPAYKPDRAFYDRMLAALGRQPQEVVFVGDSIDADVLVPMTCGMSAIWLNRQGLRAPDVGVPYEIANLGELETILAHILTNTEADAPADAGKPRQ